MSTLRLALEENPVTDESFLYLGILIACFQKLDVIPLPDLKIPPEELLMSMMNRTSE